MNILIRAVPDAKVHLQKGGVKIRMLLSVNPPLSPEEINGFNLDVLRRSMPYCLTIQMSPKIDPFYQIKPTKIIENSVAIHSQKN